MLVPDGWLMKNMWQGEDTQLPPSHYTDPYRRNKPWPALIFVDAWYSRRSTGGGRSETIPLGHCPLTAAAMGSWTNVGLALGGRTLEVSTVSS